MAVICDEVLVIIAKQIEFIIQNLLPCTSVAAYFSVVFVLFVPKKNQKALSAASSRKAILLSYRPVRALNQACCATWHSSARKENTDVVLRASTFVSLRLTTVDKQTCAADTNMFGVNCVGFRISFINPVTCWESPVCHPEEAETE